MYAVISLIDVACRGQLLILFLNLVVHEMKVIKGYSVSNTKRK